MTDVGDRPVVVGGGIAGVAAALRLAELGHGPILVEGSEVAGGGGSSPVSGGVFHLAWGAMDERPSDLVVRLGREGDGRIPTDVARGLAANAARSMDWLRARGVDIAPKGRHPHEQFTLQPPSAGRGARRDRRRGPERAMRALYGQLADGGVRLHTGTRLVGLHKHADGLELALSRGGARRTVRTTTVVVADGGFHAAPDLLDRFVGHGAAGCFVRATRASTGEGLRALIELGAAVTGMDRLYGHMLSAGALENEDLWPHPTVDVLCRHGLVVDREGRRVGSRDRTGIELVNLLARSGDPRGFSVVFDGRIGSSVTTDATAATGQRDGRLARLDEVLQRGAPLLTGRSVVQLADRLGIDPRALDESLRRHRRAHPQRAIDEADLLAMRIIPGISQTLGGVLVDAACRVLSTTGTPMPGLYAAGDVVAVQAGDGPGYIGGLATGLIQGLLAAEAARRDRSRATNVV